VGRKEMELACDMSVLTTPHVPAEDNNDTSRMPGVFLMRKFWLK
jgi:hypothetical protein